MAGRAFKFGGALKELRIHLCQTSDASKGVREFVETFYVPLKQANPKFPILIRECSGVQPRAWARYAFDWYKGICKPQNLDRYGPESNTADWIGDHVTLQLFLRGLLRLTRKPEINRLSKPLQSHGKETSVSLTNLQADNVLKEIEKLASKN